MAIRSYLRVLPLLLFSACGLALGSAASLSLGSSSVGAATASTPRCTTGVLPVVQNLSAGTVISVTISGLPAACGGATIKATVNNRSTIASGSTSVPAGGGAVTVILGAALAVATSEQTDIVVVGP